jgi:hypothetical protein
MDIIDPRVRKAAGVAGSLGEEGEQPFNLARRRARP